MHFLKYSTLATLMLVSPRLLAKEQHGAHEHGKAELDIAIDGTKVVIAFESPADSIYGFEHDAKSAKDIATRENAAAVLKDAASLFQFPAALTCALTESKIETWVVETPKDKKSKHGEHGEVHANYTYTCAKSPTGSKLIVALTDKFPKLREIAVQLVSDQKQSGSTIKATAKTIDL